MVRKGVAAFVAIGLAACGDKFGPGLSSTPPGFTVVAVIVMPRSATLDPGGQAVLAASVSAEAGVADRSVTWTTSNSLIASVSANGVVTAGTAAGTATITAASKADPTVKDTATIFVRAIAGIKKAAP